MLISASRGKARLPEDRVCRPERVSLQRRETMKTGQMNWPLVGALFLNLLLWSGILVLFL